MPLQRLYRFGSRQHQRQEFGPNANETRLETIREDRDPGVAGGGPPPPVVISVQLAGLGTLAVDPFALVPSYAPLVGLRVHVDAWDRFSYAGNAYPSNGASVGSLAPRSTTEGGAIDFNGLAVPTYLANADGANRAGLRFTVASQQHLSMPRAAELFRGSNDAAITLCVVARLVNAPGTRDLFVTGQDDNTTLAASFRDRAGLSLRATAFRFDAHPNFGADTSASSLGVTPRTGETFIMVGRHGANPDRLNTLSVRVGGSTQVGAVPGSSNALPWNAASTWPNYCFLGAGRWRSGGVPTTANFSDDVIMEALGWNRRLTDTEVTTLIDGLRQKWGVA